jgi:hypothetical protein
MATSVQSALLTLEEKRALGDAAADIAALRAAIVAITAKLDLDATVTDTNYASLCNPAAAKLTP